MYAKLSLLLLLIAVPAHAQDSEADEGRSGLSVPRFVSIKPSKAYLRAGPGERFPVEWVYVRPGLPVEVISEWGIWRQLRDSEGTVGWMNKNLLTGERHAIVTRTVRTLYEGPDLQAKIVWRIEPGAVVAVVMCDGQWCRVTRDGKAGYILRSQLWGVYDTETIAN